MCTPDYPHPPTKDEEMFHQRNAKISVLMNKLTTGPDLPFSTVNILTSDIRFMRMKNKKFNIQFGLCKEIA